MKSNVDNYFKDIEKCVNYTYNYNLKDLLIPQQQIIMNLCISYDKTYLFVTGAVRTLIYYLISLIFFSVDFTIIGYLFYFIYLINLIILIFIMFKEPKYVTYPPSTPVDNPALGDSTPGSSQSYENIYPA
jgi:hypothetical protein